MDSKLAELRPGNPVREPGVIIKALGGVRVVDAVHLLFAYLFISAMIVHIYFHTLKRFRGVAGR